MTCRRHTIWGTIMLLLGLLASAALAGAGATADAGQQARVTTPPVVVAVGDIACEPGLAPSPANHTCQHAATAKLAASLKPAAVLVLGDTQYNTGALADYAGSYDKSWGALFPVTYPVPGNHEYLTAGAKGYYQYFKSRQPGPPGWYAFNARGWRLYALNSECGRVDCAAERAWLRADLEARPSTCSLIYMHQPRFSSGAEHGSSLTPKGLWRVAYRHRVDVAIGAHDHHYERFARLDHRGNRTKRGIQSFVVGTGGRSLYSFGEVQPGSVVRFNKNHGVLALTLRNGSYDWVFRTIAGRTVDSGTRRCR